MPKIFTSLFLCFLSISGFAQPDWSISSGDYQYSMTAIVLLKVEGDTIDNENDQVAAFFGNEIRGVSNPSVYVSSIDRNVVFLTLFSNTIEGEELTFEIYNSQNESIYTAINTVIFTDGSQVGTNSMPVVITESNKVNQTITFDAIPAKTFGDVPFTISATASSGLDVAFSIVSGPVTLSGNEVTIVGAGEVILAANQSGDEAYNAAGQVTQSFTIAKASQEITFNPEAIGDKSVNNAPFQVEVESSSGSAVSVELTGPATLTDEGNGLYEITLDGTSGMVTLDAAVSESDNYLSSTSSISFSVNDLLSQTITFDAIPDKTFGDAPFTISATASSGLDVAFSIVSGPVTLSGNEVTIVGAGEVILAANQSGDETYNAAGQVTQSFTIAKASQEITFNPEAIGDKSVNDAPFQVEVEISSGSAVSVELTGPATLTDEGNGLYEITLDGTSGMVTLDAAVSESDNYLSSTSSISFSVNDLLSQTITFDAIPDKTFGDAPFTISATASSGLDVAFSIVSGPVTLSGNEVTIVGAGEVILAANQSGDETYNAAGQVTQSFTIAKASQEITFNPEAIGDKSVNDAPFQVEVEISSGSAVSVELTGPATLTDEGNGLYEITLDGTSGMVTLDAAVSESDNYLSSTSSISFSVNDLLSQTITFDAIPDKIFGDAPFTISATASSGLDVAFSVVSGPVTLSGNEVTIVGAGEVILAANQSGDETYNAAGQVTQSFTIAKASQEITFNPEAIGDKSVNDAPFQVEVESSSGSAVSVELTGPATLTDEGNGLYEITLDGTLGMVTLDAAVSESDNYLSSTSSISFSVNDLLSQTITFDAIPDKIFGDAPFTISATASSGLDVAFSVVSGPVTLSGIEVTIVGAGEVILAANQSGDETYNASGQVTQSFTIAKASQEITFSLPISFKLGDSPLVLKGDATSGLPLEFSSSDLNVATISGENLLVVHALGTVTITAFQAGNENFLPSSEDATMQVVQALSLGDELSLEIYPNPTSKYINVIGKGSTTFRIFTSNGKIIMSGKLKDFVDVSNLESGVYFFELEGQSATKLIKVDD